MAVIDSLEVDIQSKSESFNKSLDELIRKLGVVADGISAIGQINTLNDFAKKTTEVTKKLSTVQNALKGVSNSIAPEMQKASKSIEQIVEQYKNLGKSFTFKGSASEIQKQIDKYTNSLETAKLKKEELETTGKTKGKAYEAAVAKTIEYTNVIENLKQQLADVQTAQSQLNFNISGIEETRQAIESVGESIRGSVSIPESAFNYNAEAMTAVFGEAASNIQDYTQAIEQFGRNARMVLNDTPQLGQLNEESRAAAEGLKELGERLSQLIVPEIREENLGKLQSELYKTEIKLDELRAKLENGLTMGRITESIDSSGYVRLQEQIALTEKQAEALRAKIAEVGNQSGSGSRVERFAVLLEKLSSVGKTVKSVLSGITSTLGKFGSVVKNAISGMAKLTKSISGIGKSSKTTNISLAGGFKTVLKYAFGIRSLYTLFNKLRSAIKEGMKNLVQYSGETNASVSLLSNSMNQLKNASAAMAAPLLNAFAPAINQIIQLCVKAANSVNQLISSIIGNGTWIKAKTLTDDYAASVSKAGKAAKGSLRPFDELKTITTQEDDGGFETSTEDMFETVEVENNFKNFAERLKEMWENADFTDLGAMIGGKIKGALENIQWDSIKQTVSNAGKSFATLINGIVEVPELALNIGKTIGDAINTGITAINSFLDNTNWDSVGKFIGEGLNGIVNSVQWEDLGHLLAQKTNALFETIGNASKTFEWSGFGTKLSDGLNTAISDFEWSENGERIGFLLKGMLDGAIVFLEGTEWEELGNGIADFIGSIPWGEIFEKLAEAAGAALGGLAALLWGLIEDAWNNVVEWWKETAFKDGKFVMDGLVGGIVDVWRNIVQWIGDHIAKPFINGFKKAFGIHSPSTVMAEMGTFLMQGLFNGISSLVQSVIDVFIKIKEKILLVWNEIKAKTSEAWNGIKAFVSNLWNGLKLSASIAFNNIKTTITNIWNGIKTVTTNIWNGIKEAVKVPINAIIGYINGMISGAVSGINGLINGFNTIVGIIPGFDLNISLIDAPQIPMLAKGAVLRGGNPFLAVVNDQKRGQTNVETPLKVIQEALREELTKFSAKIQVATPNTRMLSFNYEPAPVPSLAGAYGNYQYDTGAYTASYNNNNSDMSNVIEMAVYKGAYNAVSSAIGNSKVLGDIKDLIEEGHTIEIDGSPIYQNMIQRAMMDMRSGRIGRLVVAEELY